MIIDAQVSTEVDYHRKGKVIKTGLVEMHLKD